MSISPLLRVNVQFGAIGLIEPPKDILSRLGHIVSTCRAEPSMYILLHVWVHTSIIRKIALQWYFWKLSFEHVDFV